MYSSCSYTLTVGSSIFLLVHECDGHYHGEVFVFTNISIHSLDDTCISDKGAVAISKTIKTMTNLRELQ